MVQKKRMTSEKKIEFILSALEEKKGQEVAVLDVRGRTLLADFFVIASGTSKTHIRALVDAIIDKLEGSGLKRKRVEGHDESMWTLLDFGDVIVHIFSPEHREFYKLESYWSGAEKGSPPELSSDEG